MPKKGMKVEWGLFVHHRREHMLWRAAAHRHHKLAAFCADSSEPFSDTLETVVALTATRLGLLTTMSRALPTLLHRLDHCSRGGAQAVEKLVVPSSTHFQILNTPRRRACSCRQVVCRLWSRRRRITELALARMERGNGWHWPLPSIKHVH